MTTYLSLIFHTTTVTILESKWLLIKLFMEEDIGWFEIGKIGLIGLDLVHQAIKKVKVIIERLKMTKSHQRS